MCDPSTLGATLESIDGVQIVGRARGHLVCKKISDDAVFREGHGLVVFGEACAGCGHRLLHGALTRVASVVSHSVSLDARRSLQMAAFQSEVVQELVPGLRG